MIFHKSVCRDVFLVALIAVLSLPLFAGKGDKEYKTGKIQNFKVDRVTGAYGEPIVSAGYDPYAATGVGSYSTTPVPKKKYSLQIDTGDEIIALHLILDSTAHLPELQDNTDIQYRIEGAKYVQILDSHKRKFDFKVVSREPKSKPVEPAKP